MHSLGDVVSLFVSQSHGTKPKPICYFLYFIMIFVAFGKSSNKCGSSYFNAHKGIIIRTDDSVANGAIVLRTLHATSTKACEQACCQLTECSASVFEFKFKRLCYLFNCGKDAKLCEFEQHPRYAVSIKVNRSDGKDKSNFKVEPTKARFKPLPTEQPVSSDHSSKQRQCRFPPDVQFRCLDATKYPSCIAIYDLCDGVPQCGDASDEASCPAGKAKSTDKTDRGDSSSGQQSPSQWSFNYDTSRNLDGKGLGVADHPRGISSAANSRQTNTAAPAQPIRHVSAEPPPAPADAAATLAESYRQARSAVLGLGVALAVVLVAIVVLGCRLHRLRARIARGGGGADGKLRSRSVDDEDYLINGMYL